MHDKRRTITKKIDLYIYITLRLSRLTYLTPTFDVNTLSLKS